MEKIKPVPRAGYMVKMRNLEPAAVISEIGILGYYISEDGKMVENRVGGYLNRTKVVRLD